MIRNLILLTVFGLVSFFAKAQTTYYYNVLQKACPQEQASFSIQWQKGNTKGYYSNNKLFFSGRIERIDSSDFTRSQFADTCTWYFKNGLVKQKTSFNKEGQLHGPCVYFYESGQRWKDMNYVQGKLENSTYTEFLEDGQRYSIFEEDFNDNSNDWDLLQNETQSVRIEQGHLIMESKIKEGTSRYKYFKFDKDEFVLEASMEFQKNKKEDQGGLIYGFKDWNNYNFFIIDQEHLYLGTVFEGVKTYGIQGMYSHTINAKGANTLKLITSGEDAIFTINGNYVYKASKLPLYGNNLGFMINGKFNAKVDKITFKQLSLSALGAGRSVSGGQTDTKATGTGFFIDASGLVVSNYHVVETAKQIVVDVLDTATQTYKSYRAQVLLNDVDNDLSILKINDEQFKPVFDKIEFGIGMGNFELGSMVYTLGFPLALSGMGSQEAKFTDGKISAKTGYNGAINSFQTTIPVQPGNSGGPIFNEKGDLIGIINSKIAKADNVSYGIKNNLLINLSQSLAEEVKLNPNSSINTLSLEEKIKRLKKYVVLIRIK